MHSITARNKRMHSVLNFKGQMYNFGLELELDIEVYIICLI